MSDSSSVKEGVSETPWKAKSQGLEQGPSLEVAFLSWSPLSVIFPSLPPPHPPNTLGPILGESAED